MNELESGSLGEVISGIWEILSQPLRVGTLSLPFSIAGFVLEFLLPLFVGIFVIRFLRNLVARSIDRSKLKDPVKTNLKRWNRIIFRILGLVYLILITTFLLGAEFFSVLSALGTILNEPFYSSGDLKISVMTLLTAVPVFYLASLAGKGTRSLVEREVLGRLPVDESRKFSIANMSRYTVMLLVLIMGLSFIGIDFSSLILVFSVLGIGIGFGLQSMVSNFFAGVIIILTRPIKEGDFILATTSGQNLEGRVMKITLLHSVINTLLNETIIIPNSEIIGKPVHNYSYDSQEVIVPAVVEVHYESDLDLVEKVMIEVGRECPYWTGSTEPSMRVASFNSSGIEVVLYTRILYAPERIVAMAWLRKMIWRRFKENGIVIPYPQMDLYVKTLPPGSE